MTVNKSKQSTVWLRRHNIYIFLITVKTKSQDSNSAQYWSSMSLPAVRKDKPRHRSPIDRR